MDGTYKTDYLGIISKNLNITGEGNVVIDADNNNRILYVGTDANVVLKNVVLTNGYTSSDESGALLGNSGYLTLVNCILSDSTSGKNGGAIYNAAYLTVINSTFVNNMAEQNGGAIFTQYAGIGITPTLTITDSSFSKNRAKGNSNFGGGAIFVQQASDSLSIANTNFTENSVDQYGGGAIEIVNTNAAKITGCNFVSNSANGQSSDSNYGGGAISFIGVYSDKKETLTISDSLFEDNTVDGLGGGAIYVRTSTVNVANSVLVNNKDNSEYAIYSRITDMITPTVNANNNWWGINDSPKEMVSNRVTLNRWAILTIANDTEIKDGNTVKVTVAIDSSTDGETITKLDSPINVEIPVTVITNKGEIQGTLTNGEFTTEIDATGIKYISANVEGFEEVLFVSTVETSIVMDDITASKGDAIEYTVTVNSADGTVVNKGIVKLYIDNELVQSIKVINGEAKANIIISKDIGEYNITAKYIDETTQFGSSEANKTLTVSGINNIVTPENFHNFFDENGVLKDDVPFDELIFRGTFENVGVITVTKAIKLTGDGAQFNNASFILGARQH